MEDYLKLERDLKSRSTFEKTVTSSISQRHNPHQTSVKAEKVNLSYADLHHEITKDASPKQEKKTAVEEELIKFMSKLPNYLEKGKTDQDKALNFGVLDWGRLENYQKHVMSRSSRHSLSSSNTASSFSTTEGSTSTFHSIRGHSYSPPHERTHESSQCHLISSEKSFGKSQDVEQKYIARGPSLYKMHPEIKLVPQKRIFESCPKLNVGSKSSGNSVNYKGKSYTANKDAMQKTGTVVPGDPSQDNRSVMPPLSDSSTKRSQLEKSRTESLDSSCDSSYLPPCAAKAVINEHCDRFLEIKRPNVMPSSSAFNEPNMGSNVKLSKGIPEKARSTSPFRRLGSVSGKPSKNFSSREISLPQLSSTYCAKYGSEASTSCQQSSHCDAQNGTGRSRSSTLSRLLDPLLKPKAPSCRSGSVKHGADNIKINLSKQQLQALLRVAVKNGQPIYTFAVDNNSDVLAATMKKLGTSREDEYSCIYTFFTVKESKKKNGKWINHRSKGENHDFIPNAVAQLKVSGSQFSTLCEDSHLEQSFARQYVLFAIDPQQENDELAAVVVKAPKVIGRRFESIEKDRVIGSQSLMSVTVILPSGIHSLPSKGGPSSLIQRWRSGGSCDCGGWDLGCKLKILENQNRLIKKSTTSESLIDAFELCSQGEEGQPVFRFAPFKDGIYSVDFSSSLSVLRVFSVCIAVLDAKYLHELWGSSNCFEGKTCTYTISSENHTTRAINQRYASYPPHSPVGRV